MEETYAIVVRTLLTYFTLFLLTRIMGKREISQFTYFDYIVGITIGSLAANVATNLQNGFPSTIWSIVIFAMLQIIFSYVSYYNKRIRSFTEGKKTLLIQKGEIDLRNLRKERVNIDELESLLRNKGYFNIKEVETAYLETDGRLSVQDNISTFGYLLIEEGVLNQLIMKKLGISNSWLVSKVNQDGIDDLNKIYNMQIDKSGKFYYDLKN